MKKIYLALFSIVSFTCFSQDLITSNNSFNTGFSDWGYGVWGDNNGKPVAKFEIDRIGRTDNSSFKVKVRSNTKNGAGNKAILRRSKLKIKKGKEYTLSFWIKSLYPEDQIYVSVYSGIDTGSKNGWAALFIRDFNFEGNNKWQNIVYNFKAGEGAEGAQIDYKNLDLIFGFDKRKGSFWIDDVTITRRK